MVLSGQTTVDVVGQEEIMVDTCPLTEDRARMLMSIDAALTDSDFPETIIDALLKDQKPLDPEFSKVVDEHFWDLI